MIVSQRVVEQQCDKIWNSYCKAQKTEGDKEADRERGGAVESENGALLPNTRRDVRTGLRQPRRTKTRPLKYPNNFLCP